MTKKQLGPVDIFLPCPAALVASGSMEEPNIATVAWVGMVSSTPPMVGVSLDKRRFSLELIHNTGSFTVNIPDAKLVSATDYCGLVSGRAVKKFEEASLTPVRGNKTPTPIIEECPINLECRVSREIELGDYILILGEILETQIDSDKVTMAVGERPKIDVAAVDPLVYCATIREYWSVGRKLGDAFKIGIKRSDGLEERG